MKTENNAIRALPLIKRKYPEGGMGVASPPLRRRTEKQEGGETCGSIATAKRQRAPPSPRRSPAASSDPVRRGPCRVNVQEHGALPSFPPAAVNNGPLRLIEEFALEREQIYARCACELLETGPKWKEESMS